MTPAVETSTRERIRLDVHRSGDAGEAMANDVRVGLTSSPKALLPKYFYDARGSELFEQITELPEYYQTRTELQILLAEAGGIVERHRPTELVELGSGSSRKTVALLDAMDGAGLLDRFIPFDVSPTVLMQAAERIATKYPNLSVHAVAGDFDHHLASIPPHAVGARRLIVFLGGTIGNLLPAERRAFLRTLRALLQPGDRLLLGTDLVKDRETVEAAYNDAEGVTAQFNLNVLSVINRELGGDFDPARFEHVAFYDDVNAWIEMRLRSLCDQVVHVRRLGLEVHFAKDEEMRTEISCKFTRASLARMAAGAGLRVLEVHSDPLAQFAVSIIARDDDPGGSHP